MQRFDSHRRAKNVGRDADIFPHLQVNNVSMKVSSMWLNPGNTYSFALDSKSYQQYWTTAKTTNESAVTYVGITTTVLLTCVLIVIACNC